MKWIVFLAFFCGKLAFSAPDCSSKDQSLNMCAGSGYCTSFPLGKFDDNCGSSWTIPPNWTAAGLNCLKNQEKVGTYSCRNGGKVDIVICGKSNCYRCICN